MKMKVYVASPYTHGDPAVNVKRQMDMGSILLDMGMVPYIPLLTHFLRLTHPKPYNVWLQHGFEWVTSCDVLLRLNGISPGADLEVEVAGNNEIPVFREITDLLEYARINGYETETVVPYTLIRQFETINSVGV